MTQCQTCQSQLLHHLYGVLDDAETSALVAHLGDCPDCQAALDKARGQQQLLAAAARAEFPGVRFEPIPAEAKPQITRVASSPRRFAPRRWAIAASILVLVGGPVLWVATMWVNQNVGSSAREFAGLSKVNETLRDAEEGHAPETMKSAVGKKSPIQKTTALDPYYAKPMPASSGAKVELKSGVVAPPDAGAGGFGGGGAAGGGKGGGGGPPTVSGMPPPGAAADGLGGKKDDTLLIPSGGTLFIDSDRAALAKGGKVDGKDGKPKIDELITGKGKFAATDRDKKMADALVDKAKDAARDHKGEPGAGQLTAGSFDDTRHASSFKRFLQTLSQNSFVGGIPNQFKGRHVTITVKDSSGMPVDNARVEIRSGNTSIQLLSRTDGRVIVVTPWDPLPDNAHWTVTVSPPDAGKAVTTECTMQMDKLEVVLPESRNMATRILDLALVIDCTGSMGDELAYIKSEMQWIATSIKEKYPEVKQRYALIVYRDKGDEYVTRTFQFTESIDQLLANVKAQSANGGGDMPEAVEKAMDEAMQLQWSAGRAARVLIHAADAPPHQQDFEYSLRTVDRIRKAGIAFYPVACSGYDPPCELHMRVSSLLTGGQFLFLTDDSGIGNSHAEPHVHDYHVERLAPLLVRMISSEIAGNQIDANPQEIIRTVGNPAK